MEVTVTTFLFAVATTFGLALAIIIKLEWWWWQRQIVIVKKEKVVKMSGPFFLLPEEVWELILDRLTDSKDAWNLFRAFPELDTNQGLQKKKHTWLFGMVIPHLVPSTSPRSNYIQEGDLLNCRLLSKRWSAHVDTFLESQNQLRAFHCFRPQPQVPGQFYWNPKTYLEVIDEVGHGMIWPRDKYFLGGSSLHDHLEDADEYLPEIRTVGRFLHEMGAHPQDRSPFLSGAVSFFITDENFPEQEGANSWNDNDICILIDKFGKHIYHLKIDYRKPNLGPLDMVQCLRRLPNLRSLCLRGDDDEPEQVTTVDVAKFLGKGKNSFPSLPQFETLRLRNSFTKSGQLLIRQYSGQIRKLQLEIGMWRQEYSNLFPNLAELEVTDIERHYERDEIGRFMMHFGSSSSSSDEDGSDAEDEKGPRSEDSLQLMLKSLQAPLLAMLKIKYVFTDNDDEDFGSNTFVIEDDIFQWLKRFPNLRYLNFGEECGIVSTIEKGTLSPEKDLAPSLQFLSIRTSPKMSYDFLRCLPALEHLQLYVHRKPMVIDNSSTPAVQILEEIQTATMYNSNIWELLPKLRTVTLLGELFEYCDGQFEIYKFNREGYDHHLKQAKLLPAGSSNPDMAPLRPDIVAYLEHKAERAEEKQKKDKKENSGSGTSFDDDSDGDGDQYWSDWDWKVWERREVYGWEDYASDYVLPYNPNVPDLDDLFD